MSVAPCIAPPTLGANQEDKYRDEKMKRGFVITRRHNDDLALNLNKSNGA